MKFGGTLALAAALILTGCAQEPPPVSDKVAEYYAKHTAIPTPTVDSRPFAVFIGDSYTQGTGATMAGNKWVEVLARDLNWGHVNLGRGGTGYVSTSGPEGCGLSFCPAYKGMVEYGLTNEKASYFVVSGGQNDFEDFRTDPTTTTAAIEDVYQAIRAARPDVKIVAVGPSTPWTLDPDVLGLDSAVQAAAAKVNATYVSMIEPPVFTESMILEDGSHVNNEGHAAIAARVGAALK